MPSLQSVLLLSVAAATTVSAQGFQRLPDHEQQATLTGNPRPASNFVISARDEISVTHLAEIAEAELSIEACTSDREVALGNVGDTAEELQKHYESLGLESLVTAAASLRTEDDEDGWRYGEKWPVGYRRKGGKDVEDDKEHDDEKQYCADASLTLTISDLSLVANLAGNLTGSGSAEVKLEYINWQLTPATKTALKSELRLKAIAQMTETGKDYAAAFGFEGLEPVEVNEEYGYMDTRRVRKGNGWYRGGRNVELEAPMLEMQSEFSFKFGA